MTPDSFADLRYGLFIHYGLYSMPGRGEWAMNREGIAPGAMDDLAKTFNPSAFDAEAICDLAAAGGMKYVVFTTMHHDGFRLYDTALSPFSSSRVCGRDLTAELVAAARRRGLKVGLYHSLNNWHDQPDAVAAFEDASAYSVFIEKTTARLVELVTRFDPIDILWYDGWWPFDAEGWQAERMNAALRAIQPHLLFNGRNGLPGDFGTPEGHLTTPEPWRPWEACMTLNDHWGFHRGDENWKPPIEVVKMLLRCAAGRGNLLLNIGPRGDGSVPEGSVDVIQAVGRWLRDGGEAAVAATDPMTFDPMTRAPGDRGDWDPAGVFTASGNTLFFTLLYPPGPQFTLTGLEMRVESVEVDGLGPLAFEQRDGRLVVELPDSLLERFCPVLRMACDAPPSLYRTGGMRPPSVKHPRYDPVSPDILYY
ncbi:MAG: alpha-L-fucosidase [Kiritimatiellia bacterium]|jgi:alpha-L-fucosidase